MFYMQEFELMNDEGYILALPFDLEGGTQGASVAEVMEMAGEWLRDEVLSHLESERELPATTFGNEPTHGGRVVLVGVYASLSDVPSMSAAEAADALGVSRPRVSKMIETGQLRGWKDGRNTRVSIESVEARRAGEHGAGRPKKVVAA